MLHGKPLAIDLYCGLGGWTEGLLAEGYRVVGFDVEHHVYGNARYPAQLVLQDVLTIHGSQFKDAALIVASPPCQEYSYMAMPWSRAKQIAAEYRDGTRNRAELTALFDACFRIQREASEAAGRYIPLVVENVHGAQPWVGRAKWHFGSFYLWGDVPALMPMTKRVVKRPGHSMNKGAPQWGPNHNTHEILDGVKVATMGAGWYPPGHPKHVPGLAFNGHADRNLRATKNNGGSWFAIAHNTTSGHGQNPDGRKMPEGDSIRTEKGRSAALQNYDQLREGFKQGGDWFNKESGKSISRRCSSRSQARKAASAHIAKIPITLSRHIGRAWHPESC